MDKHRKNIIIAVITGALLIGNAAWALAFGEREPQPYDNVNDMKYEVPERVSGTDLPMEFTSMNEEDRDKAEEDTEKEAEEQEREKKKESRDTEADKGDKNDRLKPSDKKTEGSGTPGDSSGEGEPVQGGGSGGDKPGLPDKTPKLLSISAAWLGSSSLEYGSELPRGAIHVTAHYDNGKSSIVTGWTVAGGFNSTVLGPGTLKIEYQGKTTTVSYNIVDREIALEASWKSGKGSYRYKKDSLQKSDINAVLVYLSGARVQLDSSGFSVKGFSNSSIGNRSITVSRGEFSSTLGYSVTDYITGITSTLSQFAVRGDVSWSEIIKGEHVYAEYASGSRRTLSASEYSVSGYSCSRQQSDAKVSIQYGGEKLNISYTVYPGIIKARALGLDRVIIQDVHFTKETRVSSPEDVDLSEEYLVGEDVYRFAGFFSDSDCTVSITMPETISAGKSITRNANYIEEKIERYYFVKYEKVNKPEENPPVSGNPVNPTDPNNPGNPVNPTDPNNPGNQNGTSDTNNPANPSGTKDPNASGSQSKPADTEKENGTKESKDPNATGSQNDQADTGNQSGSDKPQEKKDKADGQDSQSKPSDTGKENGTNESKDPNPSGSRNGQADTGNRNSSDKPQEKKDKADGQDSQNSPDKPQEKKDNQDKKTPDVIKPEQSAAEQNSGGSGSSGDN